MISGSALRIEVSRVNLMCWALRVVNSKTGLSLCENGTNGPEGLRLAKLRLVEAVTDA